MRLRVQFDKSGAIRFTSHKDIVRLFQRCFAAAEIPVTYTEGFHPHIKMSFGPPLRTSWESRAEFLDVHLERSYPDFVEDCNRYLPDGLRVVNVVELDDQAPKLANDICAVELDLHLHHETIFGVDAPPSQREQATQALHDQLQERLTSDRTAGVDPRLDRFAIEPREDGIGITYFSTVVAGKAVTPDELLELLLDDPEQARVVPRVTRLAQFCERNGDYVSPMSKGVVQAT